MAKVVLTTPSVVINGTDLSAWITNITLETKYDILDTTAYGSTARTRVAGLADNSITLDFIQDFASTAVEATIYSLLGTTTTIVVQPLNTAASTTNPKYTVSALVSDWTPLKGAIGQLSTASVTWPVSGNITKAFS